MTPFELVKFLSFKKAEAVGNIHPDALVIGADSLVVLDGKVIGKPADKEDAVRTLSRLSGRRHELITGITLVHGQKHVSDVVTTSVFFRHMTPYEIGSYVETEEPFGKAGCYTLEGRGCIFIEKIDGDYTHVIGLPLCRTAALLKLYGISVLGGSNE